MVSLSERRPLRNRVLHEVYEKSDGTSALVSAHAVRESLGISDQEMGAACEYLSAEGFVRVEADPFGVTATPSLIGLTHRGIVHLEESTGA